MFRQLFDCTGARGLTAILWAALAGAGLWATLAATASPTAVQGVLMDRECSSKAEVRVVPGARLEGGMLVAYAHTRQCA